MKALRWLLPAASLAVVAWFTLGTLRQERQGPGPLHPAHAAAAALQQGQACEGCHEPGAGVAAARCETCHAAVGAQRREQHGLHGRLDGALAAQCARCHGDHHGDAVPLIAPHAWAMAGVPDPSRYDHAHVAFTLGGVHRQLACPSCHRGAEAGAPPAGGRFLGLRQDCVACHDDVHRGAFGGACRDCHGEERPFRDAPGFAHGRFALRDAHAAVACAACHPAGSPFAIAAEQQSPPPVRACSACHADPHGAAAGRAALRLADTADCARCHAATTWAAARPSAEAHAGFGFPLRGAHAAAACAACHGDGVVAGRWPAGERAPALAACASCHRDPHAAPLVAAATAVTGPADGCAGCHGDGDATWRDGRITAAQHAAIGFALTAPHAEVACAACHRGAARDERFPGRAAADCRRCHADVHQGQFADEPRWQQCTACHATAHWTPHGFGVAAHATTAFALTGAHAAVGCPQCHPAAAGAPRRFAGTAAACSACHADVHRGRFDRPGLPPRVDGREGCARCHDTAAFAPVTAGFDHAQWTGYELVGAHARATCAACHAPVAGGPRLGPAAGQACSACHSDPHAGQFADRGATDCTRCHDAVQWRPAHFDHARQSRFALDAVHAKLACSACHTTWRGAGGAAIVRYKPLGTTCGDCHRLGPDGKVRK